MPPHSLQIKKKKGVIVLFNVSSTVFPLILSFMHSIAYMHVQGGGKKGKRIKKE